MINKCHLWSYWIIKVTLLNKIIMTMIFGYNQVANIFNMNIWSLTEKLFIGLWKFQDKAVCFCCLQWWFRSEVWSTDITEQHGAVWGGSITLCCCHLTCNASDVQPGQWCHCCWVNHSRKKKKEKKEKWGSRWSADGCQVKFAVLWMWGHWTKYQFKITHLATLPPLITVKHILEITLMLPSIQMKMKGDVLSGTKGIKWCGEQIHRAQISSPHTNETADICQEEVNYHHRDKIPRVTITYIFNNNPRRTSLQRGF